MTRVCVVCGEMKPLDVEHFIPKGEWFLHTCRLCDNERQRRSDAYLASLPRCVACDEPATPSRIYATAAFCEVHEPTLCVCTKPVLRSNPNVLKECRRCYRLVWHG